MVALGLCALSFAGLLWLPGRSWARLPAVLAPMLALLATRLGSWGQLPFAASLLLCLVLLALLLVVALLPVGRGHAGGPEAGTTSFDALSAREAEVLRLLLTGMTQAEAAECLGIKASTVGTYCRRALDKLGAGSLGEVAATLPPQARGIDGPSMSAPVAGGACIVLVAVSALGWTGWRLSGIATLMAICCVACTLGLGARRPAKGSAASLWRLARDSRLASSCERLPWRSFPRGPASSCLASPWARWPGAPTARGCRASVLQSTTPLLRLRSRLCSAWRLAPSQVMQGTSWWPAIFSSTGGWSLSSLFQRARCCFRWLLATPCLAPARLRGFTIASVAFTCCGQGGCRTLKQGLSC